MLGRLLKNECKYIFSILFTYYFQTSFMFLPPLVDSPETIYKPTAKNDVAEINLPEANACTNKSRKLVWVQRKNPNPNRDRENRVSAWHRAREKLFCPPSSSFPHAGKGLLERLGYDFCKVSANQNRARWRMIPKAARFCWIETESCSRTAECFSGCVPCQSTVDRRRRHRCRVVRFGEHFELLN